MSDDIIARLRCTYRAASEFPCEGCTFCAARAEIEGLRAAGDALADALAWWGKGNDAGDAARAAWEEARRG